jgi:hypothetical protein
MFFSAFPDDPMMFTLMCIIQYSTVINSN